MRRFLLAAAMAACATAAHAELSNTEFQQALDSVHQYAIDMTTVVPCLYGSQYLQPGEADIVDAEWGDDATIETINRLRKQGASDEQIGELVKTYMDNYKPDWTVPDIRAYGRLCVLPYMDTFTVAGESRTLAQRQPFLQYVPQESR